MSGLTPEQRKQTRAMQLAQVGWTIATPLIIGVALDYWLGTMPWCTVIGALLGPVVGFVSLLNILRTAADDKVGHADLTESRPETK